MLALGPARAGVLGHDTPHAAPAPRSVPKELVAHLAEIHDEICAAWDRMYPHNPVNSQDDDND